MINSDQELISRARSISGYTDGSTFTDSDVQTTVQIAKDEIRSYLERPSMIFYQEEPQGTFHADQALFWMVAIGLKIRAGEIGSVNLTVSELEQESPPENFRVWFDNFQRSIRSAASDEAKGPVSSQIERDERDYAYNQPDYGGGT